jgi:hypothetical protein
LAFLHDQLAVNQEKLRDILGSGAEVISKYSADSLVGTVDKESPQNRADTLAKTLRKWGMEVSHTQSSNGVQFVISCPYAEYVHPRLSARDPVCPLSEYVLGEVRLSDRGATLESNALTEKGSRFAIRLSPEGQGRRRARK